MKVYRISNKAYSKDISGYGAQLNGGRYNPVGIPALYTAEHISLACLEILVHANTSFKTLDYALITLDIPETSILEYTLKDMPAEWTRPAGVDNPLDIGTQWLAEYEFLALKVPSVIVPYEHYYVLNPKHSLFRDVEIIDIVDFHFDRRLFKV